MIERLLALLMLSPIVFAGEYIICTGKFRCTPIDAMKVYDSLDEAMVDVHIVCNSVYNSTGRIDTYEDCLRNYFIEDIDRYPLEPTPPRIMKLMRDLK